MTEKEQQQALFWCTLLRPLIYGEVEPKETARQLREIAQQEVLFPDGKRKTPSLSTLRRKWKQFQTGGFEALVRKRRKDRGKSHKYSEEMLQFAIELKKEQPLRSDETINQFLKERFDATIPKSTLYWHLRNAGATRLKLGIAKTKIRSRWTRDQSNELWLGDFEHGPFVLAGNVDSDQHRPVPTRLSAFIDCHSRYIVSARYYFSETFDVLCDSLIRAWQVHGASRELYLDNAKVYRATALKSACYKLNIKLIHRPPREPAPGGLIERFFNTVQGQFEAEVRAGEILTLEQLNRSFTAWLTVSYHQRKNSETGQSPQKRYHQGKVFTRRVDITHVTELFMKQCQRTVHRIHCDVQIENQYFLVTDAGLRGDAIEVRYDPYSPLEHVLLYSLDGMYLGKATRYQREKGAHQQPKPSPTTKPQNDYLQLLEKQHDALLAKRAAGIDYHQVPQSGPWPFMEFLTTWANLLGRSGGLSAFTVDELESLENLYQRVSCDAALLRQAFERADEKSIPCISHWLMRLCDERNS